MISPTHHVELKLVWFSDGAKAGSITFVTVLNQLHCFAISIRYPNHRIADVFFFIPQPYLPGPRRMTTAVQTCGVVRDYVLEKPFGF